MLKITTGVSKLRIFKNQVWFSRKFFIGSRRVNSKGKSQGRGKNLKNSHSAPRKGFQEMKKSGIFTKNQLSDLIHQRRVEKVFDSIKPLPKFPQKPKRKRKLKRIKSKIDSFLKPPGVENPLKNELINKSISKAESASNKYLKKKPRKEKIKGEGDSKINLKVTTSVQQRKTPFYGHLKLRSLKHSTGIF